MTAVFDWIYAAFLKSRLLLFSFYHFVIVPNKDNGKINLDKVILSHLPFGFLVVLFFPWVKKDTSPCYAITCHFKLFSGISRLASDEFTAFGHIFMTYNNRGSGKGGRKGGGGAGPDPAFPLLFHENPASPLFFFMKIPHSVEFSHRYLESRFSFPEKYIKKSFLQKIINAGCRLAPRIHILNLHVFFKVPAKKKCLFYLSMMKEHDMIIAIWVFSEDFTLSNFY